MLCLDCLELAIEAALLPRTEKQSDIKCLRVKIEVIKTLVRNGYELTIITPKIYFDLAKQLVEISKMAAGWLRYAEKGERL